MGVLVAVEVPVEVTVDVRVVVVVIVCVDVTVVELVVVGVVVSVLDVLMGLSVTTRAFIGFSRSCVTTYGWRVNYDRARGKREKEQV